MGKESPKREDIFVNVMGISAQAFQQLYLEDCIHATLNPFSNIRWCVDGTIAALRPDLSGNGPAYKIRFSDVLGLGEARINIILNLKDNNSKTFDMGFMSDWVLDYQSIHVSNYSNYRRDIVFSENHNFDTFANNLFTDLTQMIKKLVRISVKELAAVKRT